MLRKIGEFLKQPLGTAILILIGTSLVQQYGWRSQQRYLDEQWKVQQKYLTQQLRSNTLREQRQNTIDQVTVAVGKLLTSDATIVGAHEEKVATRQLNENLDQYHVLQREWDQTEDLLKLRMTTLFSDQQIQSNWFGLLNKLGSLDSQIHQLHEFNTDDPSKAHQKQIAGCRNTINEIEKQLSVMNGLMTSALG